MGDNGQHPEFFHDVMGLLGESAIGGGIFYNDPLGITFLFEHGPYARDGGCRAFFDELANFVNLRKDKFRYGIGLFFFLIFTSVGWAGLMMSTE